MTKIDVEFKLKRLGWVREQEEKLYLTLKGMKGLTKIFKDQENESKKGNINLNISQVRIMKEFNEITKELRVQYPKKPNCFIPNPIILWKKIIRKIPLHSSPNQESEYRRYLLGKYIVDTSELLEQMLYLGKDF